MTVVNNVKAAYYNLIYARENVKVELAAVALAQELVDQNTRKVQLGAMAPLDQRQAESQAASSRADLLAAQLLQATQENTLKNPAALHLSDWDGVTPASVGNAARIAGDPRSFGEPPPYDDLAPRLAPSQDYGGETAPDHQYTHNQLYPEVDLTGSYGRNAEAATSSTATPIPSGAAISNPILTELS